MTSDRFCTTMMDGSDDAAYIAEAAVDLLSRDPPTFRDPYSSKSYMPYLVSVMRSASPSGKSKGEHSLLREFSEEVESSGIPTSGYGALVDAMAAPPRKGVIDGSSMASLLVELVDPKPGEVFLDPFCGYGLTLTVAWDRMGQCSQSPVGYTSDLYDQACSSMILHGKRSVPVMKGSPWDLQWAKGGKRPDAVACDLCGKDTSGRPVLEALDAVLDSAGTGARVAVAVPREPVVSDDTSDAEVRDRILSGNTLRGVVSVGRDRMVLLFVARKANSSDTIFYSLPAGGNDLDKMVSRVRDGKRGVAGASTRAKVRDSVWWPLGKKA